YRRDVLGSRPTAPDLTARRNPADQPDVAGAPLPSADRPGRAPRGPSGSGEAPGRSSGAR
ncbi:hypothetical protein ACFYMI_31100, partial [Streptomyces collinus]